ncbi:MAG: fluoride efflux transporter CrcB [Acidiferrobacteraceae bacterium]|jgi:CrcB protein
MWSYVAVAIGGVLGCWARYYLTGAIQSLFGRGFPYATLLINVVGAFLMGFLFVETLEHLSVTPAIRAGILVGVIGGFTTFSTFAMETLLLAEEGDGGKAVLYVVLSVVLGVSAAFGGVALAHSH